MKRIFIFLMIIVCGCKCGQAKTPETIRLNAPDKTRGTAVMQALADRHSERTFSEKKLSVQDLSDLLWAANGVNRPESGMRTAPSAMNKQDVDVYAVLEEGAYIYDAKAHELKLVAAGDHRNLVAGGQEFAAKAPVCLLLVSDISRFGDINEDAKKSLAAMDAGIVSQNIALFCAACGLSTVPRASMNVAELTKTLKLSATQLPLLNNPVGYPTEK